MDAKDDRLEERLKHLGQALDREIGPVDANAGWKRMQAQLSKSPRAARRRHQSRSGLWVAAAAVLAAILIGAPYLLHQNAPTKNPGPAAKTHKTGPSIPIGNVSAVDFLTGQEGFATVALGGYGSQNALLSTADGGASWALHKLPQGYTALALHFTSTIQGYVIARGASQASGSPLPPVAILSTQNGGQTWTVDYSEPGSGVMMNGTIPMRVGFQFFGAQGYAFVGDKVLTTTDGKTWTALTLPSGFAPVQIDFLSPTSGYVAGQLCAANQSGSSLAGCVGQLLETTDGGQTWSAIFTPTKPSSLWADSAAVSFANAQDGWFYVKDSASWLSYLYQTTDGGKTWTQEQPTSSSGQGFLGGRTVPGAITFATPEVGWLPTNAGAAPYTTGLLITSDGGNTWTSVGASRNWSMNGVSLVSATEGYAAGVNPLTQQGFLVKTTDGGKTWTQVLPSLSPASLVDFTSSQVGFGTSTATDPRAFLATTDGGESWTERSLLPANTVGLSFVSPSEGYVVQYQPGGSSAKIYRTTDGGHTWQSRTTLTISASALLPNTPYIHFFDAQRGVLETQTYPQLVIEATSDGGKTWQPIMTQQKTPGDWQQFSYVSPSTGYELATSGSQQPSAATLKETTDGGKTWHAVQQFPSGDWGQAVYFSSAQDGWVALETSPTSQNAQTWVMATTDGGKTWTRSTIPGAALQPNYNSLLLQFPDAQHGWIIGAAGRYRTNDGGATWTEQP